MQIRKRLTFQFVSMVALVFFFASVAIYFFFEKHRQWDFYNRLKNNADNTAKLFIEIKEVSPLLLKKIKENNPTTLPNEKIIILNEKNEEIYNSNPSEIFKITHDLISNIHKSRELRLIVAEHQILGFSLSERQKQFVVIASALDTYGFRKLDNLINVLYLVFGISVIMVFIAGWVFSGRALKPILQVIKQVDEITFTSLNLRVKEGKENDEISKLSNTFNKMLQRLETAFKVQKNFIANASHELRTPLTAITGQLEVSLMNDRNEQQYKQTMTSVLDDMKGLNNISNRLLLLAQTDTDGTEDVLSPVRIDEILWTARTDIIKHNMDYKIIIAIDNSLDEERKLTIPGDGQLLKTAITNLMENGCKYSADHKVEVLLTSNNNNLAIQFKDHGIGIDEEDIKHIFQPFHRGKNAINTKGHGIGLSLAERVVKHHGGTISFVSKLEQGSTFTVSIPYGKVNF